MPQEILPTGTSLFDTNMSQIQTKELAKCVVIYVSVNVH